MEELGELFAAGVGEAVLVDFGVEEVVEGGRVGTEGGMDDVGEEAGGFLFVEDLEAIGEADEVGAFGDDVAGEAVQGADAVAEAGEEAERFGELAYAVGEVVYGGVDEGDDEDFLVVAQVLGRDELGGEGGESPGFTATRHGGDAEFAAAVAEDAFLGRAGGEGGHGES